MKIFETVQDYRQWRKSLPASASVGFVPTMGALHDGHAKLLLNSIEANEFTVLSIFVNPTQFNQKSDYDQYPSSFDDDVKLAHRMGVDAIFAPARPEVLYPFGYRVKVTEDELSKTLCGAHRPGHFDGVLSVVMKLFQIVSPSRAYFGEKDYQQLMLIQRMVQDYFLDLEIVPVPTQYAETGLALSSRNERIARELRPLAPLLHRAITDEKTPEEASERLEEAGFKVEYIEDVALDGGIRRFAAAWLGQVRLIDNVKR